MRQVFLFFSLLFFVVNLHGTNKVLRIATSRNYNKESLQRGISPVMHEELLLKAFAAEKQMRVSLIHVTNLKELFKLLKNKKVDIIFDNLSITSERKKDMFFSTPVAKSKVSIVSSVKNKTSGLGTLVNKNIFVIDGSSHIKKLFILRKKLKKIGIVRAPTLWDAEELLYMVGRGKVKFAITDNNFIEAYKQYRSDIKIIYTFPYSEYSAFALNKSSNKLLKSLNNFLIKKLLEEKANSTKNDWESIRKRGFIRVLTRNNPYCYFIHRGHRMGFEYELAKRFAKKHKLRLVMIVPPSWNDMFDYLRKGKGDLIASMLTITDKRKKMPGLELSYPYASIFEQIIAQKNHSPVKSLQELAGRNIAVRKDSSYYYSLKKLQNSGIAIKITALPETMETDEILRQTSLGKYKYTMADNNIFKAEQYRYPKLKAVFSLSQKNNYAWVTKSNSKLLSGKINSFLKSEYKSAFFNITFRKYFSLGSSSKRISSLKSIRSLRISKFDDMIQKHANHYSFPWNLVAAQIYQESHFNPKAKAWDGGMGLMQLMPLTAKELACHRPFNPDDNIKAGVKYMYRLRKNFKNNVSTNDRIRFALASYNGGYGHVIDARKLAAEQGLDPNRWQNNVEKAFEKLSQKKYARRARYGSCRSDIIINYVNNIYIRYYEYAQKTKK